MIESNHMFHYENELLSKYKYIAGTDEAGRGSMAGPLCVASCILNPNDIIEGLNDSKQLTPKKREKLFTDIINRSLSYSIIFIDEDTIDKINIYQASKQGMIKAINSLDIKPDYVLSDAMKLDELNIPYTSLIHGDALSASIAAASILAKVSRDHLMDELDLKYPMYGFKKHKGYVTKAHKEALQKYGACPIHRKSYEPVKQVLENKNIFSFTFEENN